MKVPVKMKLLHRGVKADLRLRPELMKLMADEVKVKVSKQISKKSNDRKIIRKKR